MAASQAVELTNHLDEKPSATLLAQVDAADGDCCCQAMMPCMSSCSGGCSEAEEEEEAEKDGHIDEEIDVVDVAIPETEVIEETVIEETNLEEKLTETVGEQEGKNILEDIITPIIDTEILNEDVKIDEFIEAIEETLEQEDITIEDAVPPTEDVVELVNDEVIPDHEEITVIDTPDDGELGINDEDLKHTEIVEIVNEQGDTVDVIIVDNPTEQLEGEEDEEKTEFVVEEVVEEENIGGETLLEEETVEEEVVEEIIEEDTSVVEEETTVVEEPVVEEEEETVVEEVVEQEEEEEDDGYGDVEVYKTTVLEVEPLTPEEEAECENLTTCALDKLLEEAEGRPLVLDFQMDTCPPCQTIAPGFEALKDEYTDVMFRKIDIYEHMDLSMYLGLPGAPAFMFWVNGDTTPVEVVTATTEEELVKVR